MDNKLHKVKVYVMVEDKQWKDLGTGQISTKYIDGLQGMCLLVHSESDDSLIMECKIYPNVPYKKQEGDIIVLSEGKDHGLAIHFQEANGCQQIWEDICKVQGKDPNIELIQEITDDLEGFENLMLQWNQVEIPNSKVSTVANIINFFKLVSEMPSLKERLVLVLENDGYIKKLLQLFDTCEKKLNIEGLQYLNSIIKGILFLNDTRLFKIMCSDEFFMDVVGCLEYDPDSDQPKRHREFLTQNVKFKDIIPITQSQLRQKIQQTYRMQYVYDIVLPTPSIVEANLLSDLTTMIFFNKIEIITMLQEDENFLLEIFAQLKDNTVCDERRHELLLFFKEFCAFAEILESQEKNALIKTLIKLGIMNALKVIVHMHDNQIQIAALDIFAYLAEYNPQVVQAYSMEEAQDSEDNDDLLINIMIKKMICDSDPEFSQGIILPVVLHALLDPENMPVTSNGYERKGFLNFFYTHCISNLTAPILSTTVENDIDHNRANICPDDYQNAQLLEVILEILTFCVQCHSMYIKKYILSNNLLSRILVLMNSKHTFLILCALRFMRKMIGLKDETYNLYIIKNNLFEPVVNVFMCNGTRYNMLNSAIIELFEFIRQENIKTLIVNIVENFFIAFESIEYVQTFKGLKTKYEEDKKRESLIQKYLDNMIYPKICYRHIKTMEVNVKEDICCKGITEEEKEKDGRGGGAIIQIGSEFPNNYDILMKIKETSERENELECPKRKSCEASKFSPSQGDNSDNGMSTVHCSSLVALVDYPYDTDGDDDSDPYDNDENKNENEGEEPPQKRPNLSL
jgi:protein phosphatase-4 regulatory subunit 3|eukprot:XP_111973.7 PREDICTED: putative SMEK homolog 3 [Mus musculus]